MGLGEVTVEGLDEFRRAAKRAADTRLPRKISQAHKKIGGGLASRVQAASDPRAVGRGAGAKVTPSADEREAVLAAGGSHRAGNVPRAPWGRLWGVTGGQEAPERPYLIELAEQQRDQIDRELLAAVSDAMKPAFHRTEP